MRRPSFDDIAVASIYRLTATNFRMSANVLLKDFQSRNEKLPGNIRAIPFYYLVSHAAELLLKCALVKRGHAYHEVKAHDLSALLEKLTAMRVPITEKSLNLIMRLARQHREHDLRYTALLDDGKPVFTPEPEDLFETLDELLMAGRISTHGI
jgi:HEPN domain-containing protein